MSDMQWDSPRETELSLQGARRAVTSAVKGAGVWVRGLASEIRGWGAGCAPRALEVQDLPVCEAEAVLGPPVHTGACSEKREAGRCAGRGALKGSRGEEQGAYLKAWYALGPGVELLPGGCGASHSACSLRRGPQLCPEPAQTPTFPEKGDTGQILWSP